MFIYQRVNPTVLKTMKILGETAMSRWERPRCARRRGSSAASTNDWHLIATKWRPWSSRMGDTRPGKHTKNYGKSPCLMGKSPFFMGKSPFFVGKSPFFNGKITIFNGKTIIFNGKITIFNGKIIFLMGKPPFYSWEKHGKMVIYMERSTIF